MVNLLTIAKGEDWSIVLSTAGTTSGRAMLTWKLWALFHSVHLSQSLDT